MISLKCKLHCSQLLLSGTGHLNLMFDFVWIILTSLFSTYRPHGDSMTMMDLFISISLGTVVSGKKESFFIFMTMKMITWMKLINTSIHIFSFRKGDFKLIWGFPGLWDGWTSDDTIEQTHIADYFRNGPPFNVTRDAARQDRKKAFSDSIFTRFRYNYDMPSITAYNREVKDIIQLYNLKGKTSYVFLNNILLFPVHNQLRYKTVQIFESVKYNINKICKISSKYLFCILWYAFMCFYDDFIRFRSIMNRTLQSLNLPKKSQSQLYITACSTETSFACYQDKH